MYHKYYWSSVRFGAARPTGLPCRLHHCVVGWPVMNWKEFGVEALNILKKTSFTVFDLRAKTWNKNVQHKKHESYPLGRYVNAISYGTYWVKKGAFEWYSSTVFWGATAYSFVKVPLFRWELMFPSSEYESLGAIGSHKTSVSFC